jgi:hypothetical protein
MVRTAAQAAVIAQVTRPERLAEAAAADVELAVIDEALTTVGTTKPHARLVGVVRANREALDPDGTEPDPTEGRRLSFARHLDGTRTLSGQLDAVGCGKLEAALESLVQAGRTKGDTRTRTQQRADALVQLADLALSSGQRPICRTVKPQLLMTITLDDFIDPRPNPAAAATGFADVWSAAQARWAASDAQVRRLVLDPDGLPLDIGRRPRCRDPRRACEAWGAAWSFPSPAARRRPGSATSTI